MAELELEYGARLAASESMLDFVAYTTPRWIPGPIHVAICDQLDRVRRREIDRLMLLCPPQHGKSTATSKRAPAYFLGHDPSEDIIQVSASADLAEGFGQDVRNCMRAEEYARVFPSVSLREDSQARGRWHTNHGGSYYAVGIGGQLYGRGGMAIIDDPFGTWADAQSQLQRDKVWDWYTGTLYNRVRPGKPIVVIQHRMHEDDLVGRLLAQQAAGGDRWEVVELPAVIDNPPWPERYDSAALIRIRDNMDRRQWEALYMQNPTPDEGTYFKREWFEMFDPLKLPKSHMYTSGDFAVTEGGGDWTDIATHAYSDETLYLGVEGWYGQTTADQWIERLIDQVAARKPFAFFGEGGPIRRAVEPFLLRRMLERNQFVRCEWVTRGADKATEARSLQAMAGLGRVKIADTEYGHRLLSQLLKFPSGTQDDAVDMAVNMAKAIDEAHPAIVPVPKDPEKPRFPVHQTVAEMIAQQTKRRKSQYL